MLAGKHQHFPLVMLTTVVSDLDKKWSNLYFKYWIRRFLLNPNILKYIRLAKGKWIKKNNNLTKDFFFLSQNNEFIKTPLSFHHVSMPIIIQYELNNSLLNLVNSLTEMQMEIKNLNI